MQETVVITISKSSTFSMNILGNTSRTNTVTNEKCGGEFSGASRWLHSVLMVAPVPTAESVLQGVPLVFRNRKMILPKTRHQGPGDG